MVLRNKTDYAEIKPGIEYVTFDQYISPEPHFYDKYLTFFSLSFYMNSKKNSENLKNRKGFLSFLLVMIFSSGVMLALYAYTQSYYSQEYSRALIAEKMYYQTLDAKHNVGELAKQGMWIGTAIYIIRIIFCVSDCMCNEGVQVVLSYIPILGQIVSVLCNLIYKPLSHVFSDVCTANICSIKSIGGVNVPVFDYGALDAMPPEDDLRRGITLLLLMDEAARFTDDEIIVVYVCADDPKDFSDCMETATSLNNVFHGNIGFQDFFNLISSGWISGKCKLFYPTEFDFFSLDWKTSCDDKIFIDSPTGYKSVAPYSNQTVPDKHTYSGNVYFNTFGVVVYDKSTGSMSAGYIPINQTFGFSKTVDITDLVSFYVEINSTMKSLIENKKKVEGYG